MIYWNIFTVLCGALIAAMSPRTWKPLITESYQTKTKLLLLTIISIGLSLFIFLLSFRAILELILLIYRQSPSISYVLTIDGIGLLVFLAIFALTKAITSAIGCSIKPGWKASLSKKSLAGAVLFAITSFFLGVEFIPISSEILACVGVAAWLLLVVEMGYNAELTRRIVGLAAIICLVGYIISAPESISSLIQTNIEKQSKIELI